MKTGERIIEEMTGMASAEEAAHLMRFFKTGKGEYGEGDRFLGIRVPATRALVRRYRHEVALCDMDPLLSSEWHEIRLAGLLLLVELLRNARKCGDDVGQKCIVEYYIAHIHCCNNWDLVDLSCSYILGEYVSDDMARTDILLELARDNRIWHRRTGIVSTWALIRKGKLDMTFTIAAEQLDHTHDLIHKATGWMLREAGKRDIEALRSFLDRYVSVMPRTTLRYAIEKMSPGERAHYLSIPREKKQ